MHGTATGYSRPDRDARLARRERIRRRDCRLHTCQRSRGDAGARRHRSGGAARVLPAAARRRALPPHRGGAPGPTARRRSRPATARSFITWESPSAVPTCRCSRRARASTRSRACASGRTAYVALSGKAAFARLAKEKRAAFLNPGFACGKQFVPDVIDRLAGGEKAVPAAGAGGAHAGARDRRRGRGRASTASAWWKIW